MADTPTAREQAEIITQEYLNSRDGEEVAIGDLIAKLDDEGMLIDPVEQGIWTLVKEGKAEVAPPGEGGELRYRLTDFGIAAAEELIERLGGEAS